MSQNRRSRVSAALRESKAFRATARFLRKFWSALLCLALVAGIAIAAVVNPGFKVADLHLDEAQVYVVRQSTSLIGNLNMPSEELANAALVGAQDYEVIQHNEQVLVKSSTPNQISLYDPATNQMGSPTNLPNAATVSVSGGLMVVTNPTNGRAWYGPVDEMLRTDFQLTPAQLEIGDGGLAVATTSGQVIGLNVQRSQLIRVVNGAPQRVDIPLKVNAQNAASIQLSAVGNRAVILDRATHRIWAEGNDDVWDVDGGSTAQLPPPSQSAAGGVQGARAVYATAAGLIAVTKDGPRSLSGQVTGAPAKPLVVGDCVYGAFGTTFAKRCANADPIVLDIPRVPQGADLRFAVNRGRVVLNDAVSGYIWLVDDGMKLITDWEKVTPEKDKKGTNNNNTQVLNPDRKKPNQAPVANDDMGLAAREGRSTILPVLDNDFDPDGDLLTVLGPPTAPGVSFQLVNGGSGLQVTLPDNAKGPIDFTYAISDGRGKSSTARARIKVLPADQSRSNQPPFHLRPKERLVISETQKGTKRVLVDWRDPDGDDLTLTKATLDGSNDEVSFTADGTLTFQDVGLTTGIKKVKLTVFDGVATTEGELLVEVVKGKVAPPVANGDYYNTTVDTDLVLEPLANDQGANLTLREVEVESAQKDVEVKPNYHENTINFKANRPGIYYLLYTVSNGPVSTGLIRVDVRGSSKENSKPVAARDAVLLPPGGSVLLDPLANDFDADGDVLVIQDVTAPKELQVTMENRHLLSIKAHRTPDRPLTISYWISDGQTQVKGTIVVTPTQLLGSQKPEANPDTFKARAGSIVTLPVMDNDRSPIGLDLSLTKIVEGPRDRAWIEGNKIKLDVPPGNAATAVSLTYEIADSEGRTASTTVSIPVVSPDANNEAPSPQKVEARVLQGTTTRILIPMDGIDINGDPVRLVGLGSGPRLGRVVAVGERYLSYEAFPNSQGTDSFRYTVVDSHGATATGEVRVGVAPQVGGNNPTTTIEDVIRIRPGATVTLPLLVNDYDIDGDNIGFVDDNPIDLPFATKIVNGNAITFTAPTEAKTYVGKYYVRDSANTTANGDITVIVDPNAPPLPPQAADDMVATHQIVAKDYVDVNVLKNDYDQDAANSQLKVSLPSPGPGVSIVEGRNLIRVQVQDRSQRLRYVITDADGGTDTAVVTIPGRNDVRPILKSSTVITVTGGERTVLDLNKLVQGTNGRAVQLTSTDQVFATVATPTPTLRTLDWTPPIDYQGPAAVVFEVTDVVPQGDKTAKTAFISVPFKVVAPPDVDPSKKGKTKLVQQPPQLIGKEPVLEVAAGEGAARIDLRSHYKDPNGDEFRFDNWRKTGGDALVDWAPQGDTKVIIGAAAAETAKPGSTIVLEGLVLDVHTNSTPAKLTIRVVPSTRPRPKAVTDEVKDGVSGRPTSVQVTSNDVSYLLKDKSLKVVSARPLGGQGDARVDGQSVIVTPAKGFVGEFRVEYTIMDATNDPNRQSTGYISVTVRDKPGNPGVPVPTKTGDGFVTLTWSDGALNGLPLKSRTLVVSSADPGAKTGQRVECGTNTCTMNGLTNGKNYRFKVIQANELGTGESAAESRPAKPDVIPEVMDAPTVQFGDGKLTVNWKAGVSRGSPIDTYELVGNGPNAKTYTIKDPKQTSFVVDGLVNDKDYTFTIRAHNDAGWAKAHSAASVPEHPTGPPTPARNVKGVDHTASVNGGWIDISWDAPDMSGKKDPITKYDVYAHSGGSRTLILTTTDGNTRSLAWKDAKNDQIYAFTVVAHNRGPQGTTSAASPPVSAYGAPPEPRGAGITAGDGTLTFSRAPHNIDADKVTEWEMEIWGDGGLVTRAFKIRLGQNAPGEYRNGGRYYARLRATIRDKTGEWGGTGAVVPIGKPSAPDFGAARAVEGDGAQVRVAVMVPDSSLQGNPEDEVTYWYSIDGGPPQRADNLERMNRPAPGYYFFVKHKTNGKNFTIRAWVTAKDKGEGAVATTVIEPSISVTMSGTTQQVRLRHMNDWGLMTCRSSAPNYPGLTTVRLRDGSGSIEYAYTGTSTVPPTSFPVDINCAGVKLKITLP